MNTKVLSNRALSVIDQYLHFKFGSAVCSVPYFNNKTVKARAALRPYVGKGSPEEIREEVEGIALKHHIKPDLIADDSLKKLLVDEGIGLDCSGLTYYVLNAESEEAGKGSLSRHISFIHAGGAVGRFMSKLNPEKNIDVATFADPKNSRAVLLKDVQPGDMVVMMGGPEVSERNHILVIHQVEYQNFIPTKMHYSHAVAYSTDGVYGSGIRQGEIEITDPNKSIIEQRWTENGKEGLDNFIFTRAQKSKTEIRRLNWF